MKKILILFIFLFLSINSILATEIDLNTFTKYKEYPTFYLVSENNKNGILMKNNKYLIIPTTEKVEVLQYIDCCTIVVFRDKFYYVDNKFNVYEVLNYSPGRLFNIIQKDGKYGLLKDQKDENILLEPIYDSAEILEPFLISHNGITDEYTIMMWIKLRKGFLYGFYDCNTNKLSEFKYKDLRVVKKGKFYKMHGWVHYYLQKKTKLGWHYIGTSYYKEMPKRIWEDTILYYGLFGFVWDSFP